LRLPALTLALALLGLVTCIPSPEDPVSVGTLCSPASDTCPGDVVLQREAVGRNQLDYTITNRGDAAATFEVLAVATSATLDGDAGDTGSADAADAGPTTSATDVLARRTYGDVAAGEKVGDRLTPQDLGIRETFRFVLRCDGCQAKLEYVFASVPVECFSDDDCSPTWQCDVVVGRCVECSGDEDCSEDQFCDEERGRCTPETRTAGCAAGAQPDDVPPPWALLGLAALLLLAVWRKRRAAATTALCCVLLGAGTARAAPPRASVSIAAGPRWIAGPLGAHAERGVGMAVGQELRWAYLGAAASISTSYFLTTQDPPPFSRGVQTYGLSLGPASTFRSARWSSRSAETSAASD